MHARGLVHISWREVKRNMDMAGGATAVANGGGAWCIIRILIDMNINVLYGNAKNHIQKV